MKLRIDKNVLLENLNTVGKALSGRNIIPILNGIKMELNSEGLYLLATDNDITIKTFIGNGNINEVIEEGVCVVFGRYLIDSIRKMPNGVIFIETTEGSKLQITMDNLKYNLNCFNENDFPTISLEEKETYTTISVKDFKTAINQTVFSTSTQESRPLLTGVNIKILGNTLECVATDSYRLSKKLLTLDEMSNENLNVVISSKNVTELIKTLEDDEDSVQIHTFGTKILFKYKNILFQSSLLNGTYPNTDSLIPNEFEIIVEVSRQNLFDSIDRASLLTQSKEKNIIQLDIKDDKMLISATSQEIGKIEEYVPVKQIKGQALTISFSSKYMIDALKSFNEDKIYLLLNGDIKPIIIRENEDGNLTQLILPIKTY